MYKAIIFLLLATCWRDLDLWSTSANANLSEGSCGCYACIIPTWARVCSSISCWLVYDSVTRKKYSLNVFQPAFIRKTITYFWSSVTKADLLIKLEKIIILFNHIFTKKVFSHDCKSRRRFITIVSRILMKLFCWCSLEIFNHFVAGSKNKKVSFVVKFFFFRWSDSLWRCSIICRH